MSDYVLKYDLLRNYVSGLIHYALKLRPSDKLHPDSRSRLTAVFVELLERQFPLDSLHQRLELRTAKDYADQLAVHVNHLNRVLKEMTGHTTTELIRQRVVQEAKLLLRQTNWTISEISASLCFEEVAHFSDFFKR